MKERISKDEFFKTILLSKEKLKEMGIRGEIVPEEAIGSVAYIEDTIETIEKALEHDLRVNYFKDEKGSVTFDIKIKPQMGFIK
jgi:hypothetical protein